MHSDELDEGEILQSHGHPSIRNYTDKGECTTHSNMGESSQITSLQLNTPHPTCLLSSSLFEFGPTLIIRQFPPTILKSQLWTFVSELPGVKDLILSSASISKKHFRIGWVTFNPTISFSTVKEYEYQLNSSRTVINITNGLNNQEYVLYWGSFMPTHKINLNSIYPREPLDDFKTLLTLALEATIKVVNWADLLRGLSNPLLNPNNDAYTQLLLKYLLQHDSKTFNLSSILNNTKSSWMYLDLLLIYLRYVHSICLSCSLVVNSLQELVKNCGLVHSREKNIAIFLNNLIKNSTKVISIDSLVGSLSSINQETIWEDMFASIEKDVTEKSFTEQIPFIASTFSQELLKRWSIKESTSISVPEEGVRCQICSKLFKEDYFIIKHLILKHQSYVHDFCKEEAAFIRYKSLYVEQVLIPHLITLSDSQRPYRWNGNTNLNENFIPKYRDNGSVNSKREYSAMSGMGEALYSSKNFTHRPPPTGRGDRWRDTSVYHKPSPTHPPYLEESPFIPRNQTVRPIKANSGRSLRTYNDIDSPENFNITRS